MPKYKSGSKAKCLHCQTVVQFTSPAGASISDFIGDKERLRSFGAECPNCGRITITILPYVHTASGGISYLSEYIVWPLSSGRPPAPSEVPDTIAQDYNEAALVLNLSPKASAALSRRCLQSVLSDGAKTKSKNLSKQIDEVLPNLPSVIAKNLDIVRQIGNFAAHEQKSNISGMVMDVEPEEAEWNLDVLDSLFDHYYVRPEIERKKRDELNKKLGEAGKPPLREP